MALGSKQKFDNDYDVIFMCYKCNITYLDNHRMSVKYSMAAYSLAYSPTAN